MYCDISKLREAMEKKGSIERHYLFNKLDFIGQHCTQDSVDKLTDLVNSYTGDDFDEEVRRRGLSKCVPFLENNTLVTGWDRQLVKSCRTYFRIVPYKNTKHELHHSWYRMDSMLAAFNLDCVSLNIDDIYSCNRLSTVLAALNTSLYFFKDTTRLLSTADGRELFNKFLAANSSNNVATLDDMFQYLSVETCKYIPFSDTDPSSYTIEMFDEDTNTVVGILEISHSWAIVIAKEDKGYTVYQFKFPDYFGSLDKYDSILPDYAEQAYGIIIEFLVLYAGYRVDGCCLYALDIKGKQKRSINGHYCDYRMSNFTDLSEILGHRE